MGPQDDPALGPLANKLQRLRDLKRRQADGEPFDIGQIAEAVSRLYAEDKISATRRELASAGALPGEIEAAVEAIRNERLLLGRQYLSDMLLSKRVNPTKNVLEYLAIFFGVSPAYFFEERERTEATAAAEAEIDLMLAVRELKRSLDSRGEGNAVKLITALARGASELDPGIATGMIHMQLAAIRHAKNDDEPSS